MKTEIRPASRQDIEAFYGAVPFTMSAEVFTVDGKIEAAWGLSFRQGRVIIFCDLNDRAREFPILMHRTAKALMQRVREAGHRYAWATVDPKEPLAMKWLARLGFEPVTEDESTMLWRT